jgi:hypothetical protein
MSRQTVQLGQGLSGTERYGTVHTGEVRQMMPAHMQSGIEPAPPSGIKYGINSQCAYVKADGERCMAPRKRETEFCVGHGKKIKNETEALLKEESLVAEEVSITKE